MNPDVVEKSVRSPFWWAYLRMLFLSHSVLEGLGVFSEGCFCHDPIHRLTTADARNLSRLQQRFGLLDGDGRTWKCPLANMRAPEFAAGDWRIAFDNLFRPRHGISCAMSS